MTEIVAWRVDWKTRTQRVKREGDGKRWRNRRRQRKHRRKALSEVARIEGVVRVASIEGVDARRCTWRTDLGKPRNAWYELHDGVAREAWYVGRCTRGVVRDVLYVLPASKVPTRGFTWLAGWWEVLHCLKNVRVPLPAGRFVRINWAVNRQRWRRISLRIAWRNPHISWASAKESDSGCVQSLLSRSPLWRIRMWGQGPSRARAKAREENCLNALVLPRVYSEEEEVV